MLVWDEKTKKIIKSEQVKTLVNEPVEKPVVKKSTRK